MSKYNLKDLLPEGMSDAEFKDAGEASRLEKHPEGDKIAKIKAMMAKEKSMKENYQMDGEVYDRIDGLVDQPLLNRFLGIFTDIYDDFIEQGEEFEVDDVVDFLTICLDKHSKETRMEDQLPDGFNEGTSGPKHADGTPKSNDEMTDDEREDYYMNLDSVDEVEDNLPEEGKNLKEHFQRFLKDYQ